MIICGTISLFRSPIIQYAQHDKTCLYGQHDFAWYITEHYGYVWNRGSILYNTFKYGSIGLTWFLYSVSVDTILPYKGPLLSHERHNFLFLLIGPYLNIYFCHSEPFNSILRCRNVNGFSASYFVIRWLIMPF